MFKFFVTGVSVITITHIKLLKFWPTTKTPGYKRKAILDWQRIGTSRVLVTLKFRLSINSKYVWNVKLCPIKKLKVGDLLLVKKTSFLPYNYSGGLKEYRNFIQARIEENLLCLRGLQVAVCSVRLSNSGRVMCISSYFN